MGENDEGFLHKAISTVVEAYNSAETPDPCVSDVTAFDNLAALHAKKHHELGQLIRNIRSGINPECLDLSALVIRKRNHFRSMLNALNEATNLEC